MLEKRFPIHLSKIECCPHVYWHYFSKLYPPDTIFWSSIIMGTTKRKTNHDRPDGWQRPISKLHESRRLITKTRMASKCNQKVRTETNLDQTQHTDFYVQTTRTILAKHGYLAMRTQHNKLHLRKHSRRHVCWFSDATPDNAQQNKYFRQATTKK